MFVCKVLWASRKCYGKRVFIIKDPMIIDCNPICLQNCSSQVCAVIRCQVGSLEKEQRVTVTIHAVLWLQSFREVRRELCCKEVTGEILFAYLPAQKCASAANSKWSPLEMDATANLFPIQLRPCCSDT